MFRYRLCRGGSGSGNPWRASARSEVYSRRAFSPMAATNITRSFVTQLPMRLELCYPSLQSATKQNTSTTTTSTTSSSTTTAVRFIHHHHEQTPVSKVCPDAKTALALSGLKSGDMVAVGGFGLGGIPETLLNEISFQENGPTSLTVISLTAGVDSFGLGRLFEAGKVKRMISSYVGENKVNNLSMMFVLRPFRCPSIVYADILSNIVRYTHRTLNECFSVVSSRLSLYRRGRLLRGCVLLGMVCR